MSSRDRVQSPSGIGCCSRLFGDGSTECGRGVGIGIILGLCITTAVMIGLPSPRGHGLRDRLRVELEKKTEILNSKLKRRVDQIGEQVREQTELLAEKEPEEDDGHSIPIAAPDSPLSGQKSVPVSRGISGGASTGHGANQASLPAPLVLQSAAAPSRGSGSASISDLPKGLAAGQLSAATAALHMRFGWQGDSGPWAEDDLPEPVLPYELAYPADARRQAGEGDGAEPFLDTDLPLWGIHQEPDEDWFKRAIDKAVRCERGVQAGEESAEEKQGSGEWPYNKGHEYREDQWPGEEDFNDDFTLVTTLMDLKRGEGRNGQFKRSMGEYFSRFQRVIDRGFKMVIYMPKEFEKSLRLDPGKHKVVHMTTDDLEEYFEYYARAQAVRTSDLWVRQGKALNWLWHAPQSQLQHYVPLVMSKMFMLRDAARWNPFRSRYLMFLDAGHYCAGDLVPGKMGMYKRHMENGFFCTHWPYGSATEVHGFGDRAFHRYMAQRQDPLQIVRGGILGGTRASIECVSKVYQTAIRQTLQDGYMGTEENILAIALKRFPGLFDAFDNNSLGGHGDNCASFTANRQRAHKHPPA